MSRQSQFFNKISDLVYRRLCGAQGGTISVKGEPASVEMHMHLKRWRLEDVLPTRGACIASTSGRDASYRAKSLHTARHEKSLLQQRDLSSSGRRLSALQTGLGIGGASAGTVRSGSHAQSLKTAAMPPEGKRFGSGAGAEGQAGPSTSAGGSGSGGATAHAAQQHARAFASAMWPAHAQLASAAAEPAMAHAERMNLQRTPFFSPPPPLPTQTRPTGVDPPALPQGSAGSAASVVLQCTVQKVQFRSPQTAYTVMRVLVGGSGSESAAATSPPVSPRGSRQRKQQQLVTVVGNLPQV
jgi:hypothetical protein